jgi:hypothetical protein
MGCNYIRLVVVAVVVGCVEQQLGQAVVIVLLLQAVLNNNLTKLDKLIKDGMPVDSRCKV